MIYFSLECKNHLSDIGVTDLDMDPDSVTIFFHVSALQSMHTYAAIQ